MSHIFLPFFFNLKKVIDDSGQIMDQRSDVPDN